MKKNLLMILILALGFVTACTQTEDDKNDDQTKTTDTIAPIFRQIDVDGNLPTLTIRQGEDVDLLQGIAVLDNTDPNPVLEVTDQGEFDKNVPGVYIVSYKLTDSSSNSTTATRSVVVQKIIEIEFKAFVIDGKGIEYQLNSEDALEYTSSGAKFRSSDVLHVMTKDFFVASYNSFKNSYTQNGQEIYFPYGALTILDQTLNFKWFRGATSPVEVNTSGQTVTPAFTSVQGATKEGLFKGIVALIDNLIPDGGYVVFAARRDGNIAQDFLVKNLFYSNYKGGNFSMSSFNKSPQQSTIAFDDNFKQEVVDEGQIEEVMGQVNINTYYYDGIPMNTYNFGDGKKKPVLFFFHGMTGDKNDPMRRAEVLARKGFFVIALDAYLHGERTTDYFDKYDYGRKMQEIVNIQIQTSKDAMHIYHKYFKNDVRVAAGKVYAFGISMGGGCAFYLATIMEEVTAIATIVGSPSFQAFYAAKQISYKWKQDDYYYTNYNSYGEFDPLINYERLDGVYIYMGNGSQDTTVPAIYAQELSGKLKPGMCVFEMYDVGHTSTSQMLENAYQYLVDHQ